MSYSPWLYQRPVSHRFFLFRTGDESSMILSFSIHNLLFLCVFTVLSSSFLIYRVLYYQLSIPSSFCREGVKESTTTDVSISPMKETKPKIKPTHCLRHKDLILNNNLDSSWRRMNKGLTLYKTKTFIHTYQV